MPAPAVVLEDFWLNGWAPAVPSVASETRTRISRARGYDSTQITWSSSRDFTDYQWRVVSSPTDPVSAGSQIASLDYASMILATAGLVSYWRLGEASGNALDSGTGANPATPTGGITRNVGGLLAGDSNGAVQVDGVMNSYLEAPYKANMNVGSAITAECWVNLSAYVVGRVILGREAYATCWWLGETTNNAYRWYVRDANNVDTIIEPNNSITVGATRHVVGVYDVAAGRCELYVNGVSVGTPNRTPNAAIRNSSFQPFDIGGDTYEGSMTGVIDEVALYNVALTAAQIEAHYLAGSGGKLAGSGGTAGTQYTSTLTDGEIEAVSPAEGSKVVKLFVQNAAGWSS